MLLIPGIILIVLGIAGYAGRGLFSADRVARREGVFGGFGPGLAVVSGAGLIVLSFVLGVALIAVLGLGGEDDEGPSAPAPLPASPPASEPDPEDPRRGAESSSQNDAVEPSSAIGGLVGPTVRLHVEMPDSSRFPRVASVVDQLDSPTVVSVRVTGSDPYVSGFALQCVTLVDEVCGNRAPFQVDEDGGAAFQYLIGDDFHVGVDTGGCRAGTARCTIVIEDSDGSRGAEIETVFHDQAPRPGRISVHPITGVEDGDTVDVSVEGFPAGAEMAAVLCVAPDVDGTRGCGAPGPVVPLLVGSDGTGSASLVVRVGPVGSERRACDRTTACGVAVISSTASAGARVAEISFAQPPGASYDTARLLIGMAIAAVLAAAALWLVRRGDWRPPKEADATEIDESAYADLDAEAAATPEDDVATV